jgi:RHS repeat-associated protein
VKFAAANNLVTVTDSGANRTLTYDANGNLTNDGNGKTYGWDAANRLVSVTQGGTVTGYVYDGNGHRVQETSNGTVVKQWVWCRGYAQPCEERDGSNNVTKRFYGQGEQIGGTNYYFTLDHLSSVREMTDASGNLVARYDYDPYGRRTVASGTDLADFGFTEFYHDQATNLDFSKARPLIVDLGRWLSRDPIGEDGGINLYDYVGNDPINLTDPLGLSPPLDVPGIPHANHPTWLHSDTHLSDVIVPTYGNWGGPDYSGGWRPSEHNGQNGPGAPIDSMDELFMQHDLHYGQYGITPRTPNSNCDQIQDPCERKKCQEKRKADNDLKHGLENLPPFVDNWNRPPPSPIYAELYRGGALNAFPWPK